MLCNVVTGYPFARHENIACLRFMLGLAEKMERPGSAARRWDRLAARTTGHHLRAEALMPGESLSMKVDQSRSIGGLLAGPSLSHPHLPSAAAGPAVTSSSAAAAAAAAPAPSDASAAVDAAAAGGGAVKEGSVPNCGGADGREPVAPLTKSEVIMLHRRCRQSAVMMGHMLQRKLIREVRVRVSARSTLAPRMRVRALEFPRVPRARAVSSLQRRASTASLRSKLAKW